MIAAPFSRETLLNVVKTLPAAPQILAQLGRLLLDINSDLNDITLLLKRDAALTARIIRISNSAIYNTGLPFASLEEALARVGYTEVYRLTGFAAVAQLADQHLPLYGMSGVQLRENALFTALMVELPDIVKRWALHTDHYPADLPKGRIPGLNDVVNGLPTPQVDVAHAKIGAL